MKAQYEFYLHFSQQSSSYSLVFSNTDEDFLHLLLSRFTSWIASELSSHIHSHSFLNFAFLPQIHNNAFLFFSSLFSLTFPLTVICVTWKHSCYLFSTKDSCSKVWSTPVNYLLRKEKDVKGFLPSLNSSLAHFCIWNSKLKFFSSTFFFCFNSYIQEKHVLNSLNNFITNHLNRHHSLRTKWNTYLYKSLRFHHLCIPCHHIHKIYHRPVHFLLSLRIYTCHTDMYLQTFKK